MTKRLLHRLQATYDLSFHIEMLLDRKRIQAYSDAIGRIVNLGDVVVDIGTGSGVLALLAAQAGAKRVYAIELDQQTAALARRNFLISPYAERIVLICGDATCIDLAEQVDTIVGEMLHAWLLEEAQAPAVKNLSRFLKLGGRLIPSSIRNFGTLVSVELQQPGCPILSPFHLWPTDKVILTKLSDTIFVEMIDFECLHGLDIDTTAVFELIKPGRVNAIALDSDAMLTPTQRVGTLPTLLPTVYFPLIDPIDVMPGERISARFRYQLGGRWTQMDVIMSQIRSISR